MFFPPGSQNLMQKEKGKKKKETGFHKTLLGFT